MSLSNNISEDKSPRWTRISQLTPIQEYELQSITTNTAGMSLYGNRARTSVMLPLELARIIAEKSTERNCTVNQIMVEMLYQLNFVDSTEKSDTFFISTEH